MLMQLVGYVPISFITTNQKISLTMFPGDGHNLFTLPYSLNTDQCVLLVIAPQYVSDNYSCH